MIKIYIRWIREGKITIEEVPLRWREEVTKILNREEEVN